MSIGVKWIIKNVLLLLLLLLSHFSHVWLCVTPETAAHQAPPSLGFSRQEQWSGLPFPSPMHESEKWKGSRSVVSDPQRPHGLQPSWLLRPWDFPGKNTGVGCHCQMLLQSKSCHLISPLEFAPHFGDHSKGMKRGKEETEIGSWHHWATSLSLFDFHALEKEMATHSSVLAWRIPGAGEPGGLPSLGSHRVGHDWSDLAAAAAPCSKASHFL